MPTSLADTAIGVVRLGTDHLINDLGGGSGREFVLSFFFPRQLAVDLFLSFIFFRVVEFFFS